MVEGGNSSLKAAKIRPMGHLEIKQIFLQFYIWLEQLK